MIANMPTPDAPRFFEAAPVNEDGVAEGPRSFVAVGRIGEPVAADPGPEPEPPDGLPKPVGLAFPVAITYPLLAITAVELNSGLSKDLQCYQMVFIPDGGCFCAGALIIEKSGRICHRVKSRTRRRRFRNAGFGGGVSCRLSCRISFWFVRRFRGS